MVVRACSWVYFVDITAKVAYMMYLYLYNTIREEYLRVLAVNYFVLDKWKALHIINTEYVMASQTNKQSKHMYYSRIR